MLTIAARSGAGLGLALLTAAFSAGFQGLLPEMHWLPSGYHRAITYVGALRAVRIFISLLFLTEWQMGILYLAV
ncbi:uncharacterized protein ASPGLDRAFT_486848 [Aspergillus glaucus CBS 516.65]|uniref:Uncharacterized protein n=1 Tax=Aspergillus glaucus CBS 516.65 TaxID=1160497 RepID=A0A1L9VFK4_ASPGL|nr:hypothetical protein ASPGLDRAFT_486848 [Aspergillus glaucus CBS 516.65]OJJ82689.1 hypothetical protein ASPGLDRAFT_486848 [Aspergillus glaucus CBS 516.65]